jgi:zinc transport system substrate-binding protein
MNKSQMLLVTVSLVAVAVLVSASLYIGVRNSDDRVQVVASFYPLAYMAEEIGGERVGVNCLIPYNTEVHSWQPSPSDIMAADNADVLLYNGAGLDHWFEDDILPALGQKDRVVVETTEGVGLLANGHQDEDETGDTDPHTWLSPFVARQQAENVYNALVEADPGGAAYYAGRWDNLSAKLAALDTRYQTELAVKTNDTIIVSHGAYGYLAYRYGFGQRGIIGLSADEQPSTATMADIADLMEQENISTLYVDPVYSDAYVQTLKSEFSSATGVEVTVLELYLMLGPTDGLDYVQQMERNLENLKAGLTG